jgi:hypothetical protein
MIRVDMSTALVLYLFAYLGLVLVCWWRYEFRKSRKQPDNPEISAVTKEKHHGHVDRTQP